MTRPAVTLFALVPLAAGCAGILGIEELSGDGGGGGGASDATTDSVETNDGNPADSHDGGGPDAQDGSASDARDTGAASEGDGEAGSAEAGWTCGTTPCSCLGTADSGLNNCGTGHESCCTSPLVDGGTFYRSYDGVTYTDAGSPATVSPFRLDKYEVTVGRFRQFVDAVVGGWSPSPTSGKHTHLNGGQGLVSATGGPESGWDVNDDANLPSTPAGWDSVLLCYETYQTWTSIQGANENLPISCETWSQAYAFCIFDGGFLPSEAEWNFAAAGGGGSGGQRVYPWSVPSTDTAIDCAHANYDPSTPCVAAGASPVGSDSPAGDGPFGQADLAGNVWEWNLDWATNYVTPCVNCAYLKVTPFPSLRVLRGGARDVAAAGALVSVRFGLTPEQPSATFGVRCARAP